MNRRNSCSRLLAVAAGSLALAAGCGQLKLPKPTAPPELARVKERAPSFTLVAPDGAEVSSGDFAGRTLLVVAAEHSFVRDIVPWLRFIRTRYGAPGRSRPAPPGPGRDVPGGNYAVLAVIERAPPRVLDILAPLLPGASEFHIEPRDERMERARRTLSQFRERARELREAGSGLVERVERVAGWLAERITEKAPSFRHAFGLVGEGPHVIAVGPDGTLVCLIDGPLNEKRAQEFAAAVDGLLARPAAAAGAGATER